MPLNYDLNKVIGLNETGFDGPADSTYRIQAWDFIIAGGALYNNLDYSFTMEHPNGTDVPDGKTPGGGSPVLRKQLKVLKDSIQSCSFIKMSPQNSVITGGVPEGATARVLAEPGRDYAIYIHHGKPGFRHGSATPTPSPKPSYAVAPENQQMELRCVLPDGSYEARWVDTKTGRSKKTEKFKTSSKPAILVSPPYQEDVALRIERQ